MKRIFFLLTALCGVASVGCANWVAEPFSCGNFYVDGFVGANIIRDPKVEEGKFEMNCGYAVGGAIGYKVSRYLSVEGEVAYRANSFDYSAQEGSAILKGSGDLDKVSALANVYVTYPVWDSLSAYVGGGLGERWDWVKSDFDVRSSGNLLAEGRMSGRDSGFAYQGIVGLSCCLCSQVHAGVEYRYLDGSHMDANHTVDFSLKRFF